jgi:hypothetical protein
MESLPDELFLLIFRYLHKFDLLYSFDNLNQRFQQIIEPYLYNIDLTQANSLPFQNFSLFLKHVLPSQGGVVRSLSLDRHQQVRLFYPHIRHVTNLQSFTLRSNNYHTDEFDECLTQVLSLKTLTELSISAQGSQALKTIASCASHNLHTL